MRIVACCLLLTACAETDPLDREYQETLDAENWRMCQIAYHQARRPTMHDGHTHRGPTTAAMIRTDLNLNRCRQVLGPYWADR